MFSGSDNVAEWMQSGLTMDLSDLSPAMQGDFYLSNSPVTRGLSLPADFLLHDDELTCASPSKPSSSAPPSQDLWRQFGSADAPPEISSDMQSFLDQTTVSLASCSAQAAANNLLSFFQMFSTARVYNVNYSKFTLRADVITKNTFPCDLKVRIYRSGGGSLVEFQRRSGDSISFFNIFRDAAAHLTGIWLHRDSADELHPAEIDELTSMQLNDTFSLLMDLAPFLPTESSHVTSEMAQEAAAGLSRSCAGDFLKQIRNSEQNTFVLPKLGK